MLGFWADIFLIPSSLFLSLLCTLHIVREEYYLILHYMSIERELSCSSLKSALQSKEACTSQHDHSFLIPAHNPLLVPHPHVPEQCRNSVHLKQIWYLYSK